MATVKYQLGTQRILNRTLDLTGALRVTLIDTAAYTFAQTHQSLADVPLAARIATSGNLTNVTFVNGVLDADDITIPNVSGASVEAAIVHGASGVDGTSYLVSYHDGLTFQPNGSGVTVTFNALGIASYQ